jgi:hypothetical protein
MKTIFNYRFNNKNRGVIKKLLNLNKLGKQNEKLTTKPLS